MSGVPTSRPNAQPLNLTLNTVLLYRKGFHEKKYQKYTSTNAPTQCLAEVFKNTSKYDLMKKTYEFMFKITRLARLGIFPLSQISYVLLYVTYHQKNVFWSSNLATKMSISHTGVPQLSSQHQALASAVTGIWGMNLQVAKSYLSWSPLPSSSLYLALVLILSIKILMNIFIIITIT